MADWTSAPAWRTFLGERLADSRPYRVWLRTPIARGTPYRACEGGACAVYWYIWQELADAGAPMAQVSRMRISATDWIVPAPPGMADDAQLGRRFRVLLPAWLVRHVAALNQQYADGDRVSLVEAARELDEAGGE